MNPFVQKFGTLVAHQIPAHPARASALLGWAYGLTAWKDAHFGGSGLKGVYAGMSAAIGKTMAQSFLKPGITAMVNIFMPCEILHAMGIIPMIPEALSVYITNTGCAESFAEAAEAADVPESFCSYHKVMLGTMETGILPKPLIVANTTLACDANQLSFRQIAQSFGIPHIVIEVPHVPSEDAVSFVGSELQSLAQVLEEVAHRHLDPLQLYKAVASSNRAIQAYREYLDFRAQCTLPVSMTGELFSLVAMHVLLGRPESERYASALREIARNAAMDLQGHSSRNYNHKNPRKRRILWLHTLPNWQDSLRVLLEQSERCEIIASDMTFDALIDMDPEKPFESMARRLVYNCNNGGAARRIETALSYAKRLHADGVLLYSQWGCKQTMGLSQLAKSAFEAEGFPTLVLDGDGCDRRNVAEGQMLTRVNAFLEQLEART